MFSKKCSLLTNPVIGLTKEVLGVIPLLIAFLCSIHILVTFYLNIPKGICNTFIDHTISIIEP
jgi:hypothetical protein